ncbi:hypothetical protein FKW77_003044 [Venturia effusa]|uniref:Uncharacterized protein n=1 Tax=Venturia effusa TaxID=50376 RepID=A0A517LL36_9PEZI|nr:hypothetical protein FKW77_003044 [Venturia effusa]
MSARDILGNSCETSEARRVGVAIQNVTSASAGKRFHWRALAYQQNNRFKSGKSRPLARDEEWMAAQFNSSLMRLMIAGIDASNSLLPRDLLPIKKAPRHTIAAKRARVLKADVTDRAKDDTCSGKRNTTTPR